MRRQLLLFPVDQILSKLQRNVVAFERNASAALSSPSLTKCAAALGSAPLADDANRTWIGSIEAGTPPQMFTSLNSLFDTKQDALIRAPQLNLTLVLQTYLYLDYYLT